MAWFKKNILFTIIMVVLAGVLAFEIYYVLGRRETARQAETAFQEKVEEYKRLSGKPILPHSNNVGLLNAEVTRQQEELKMYFSLIKGGDELQEAFKKVPESRANAYFEIASFVQQYRRKAAEANVGIPEGAAFGFSEFTSTGPAEDQIAAVHKQRLIVAYILDQMFSASPQALLSVRRPGGGGGGSSDGNRERGDASFGLDSKFSVAIPQMADTLAFQVVFTGHSDTLRTFLNRMSSFEVPLMVRNVEVAPAGEEPGQREQRSTPSRRRTAPAEMTPTTDEPKEAVPLVRDNLSRFTVALEFVDVRPVEDAR